MGTKTLYKFGGFVFDGFELKTDGKRVKLGRRAVKVLAVLLQGEGEIVTRTTLEKMVWGMAIGDRALNYQVNVELRRALGDDREYISTVHSVGYRFNVPVERVQEDSEATYHAPWERKVGDPGMELFDEEFLRKVGFNSLPPEERDKIGTTMNDIVFQAVILAAWDEMDEEDAKEFENLLSPCRQMAFDWVPKSDYGSSQEEAMRFVTEHVPDIGIIVDEEIDSFQEHALKFFKNCD